MLDMTGLDRIVSIDGERRLITAQAGATVAQLMAGLAAHKLTLPVVPGTRHVTLAGVIASDIHGKNHHRDGGLSRHVAAISLCTPAGGLTEVSPEADPELFYATLGGMGLTGVVVRRHAARRAAGDSLGGGRRRPHRRPGADTRADERHRAPSLLGGMAGPARGRAEDGTRDRQPRRPARRRRGHPACPGAASGRRGRSRRALAAAGAGGSARRSRRAAAPSEHPGVQRAALARRAASPSVGSPLAMAPYFFPLDALGEWNRLYGPAGLIQYQFVIPSGQEVALERCFELIRTRRLPVYLAVFKRFGPAFGGPLSFPLEGWTLAADLPAAAPGVRAALDELDEVVAGCGGRVYLTKDARLRRETMTAMYPELDRFAGPARPRGPERGTALGSGAAPGTVRGRAVSGAGATGSAGRRVVVLGGTSEIALAIVGELQLGARRARSRWWAATPTPWPARPRISQAPAARGR